jgi:hypothetical protein
VADQRIKGQEAQLLLVMNNVPQLTTTDFKELELVLVFDRLQEGYLGETADRLDEVFRIVRGSMSLNVENQDFLSVMQAVYDRARRRIPGSQINLKTALQFPNGQRPRIIVKNLFFGEMPFSFASRSEYGVLKLDFGGADWDRL